MKRKNLEKLKLAGDLKKEQFVFYEGLIDIKKLKGRMHGLSKSKAYKSQTQQVFKFQASIDFRCSISV